MAACKEDETNLVGSRESAATRRSALTAVVAHESLCYQKIVDMLSEHFHVKGISPHNSPQSDFKHKRLNNVKRLYNK